MFSRRLPSDLSETALHAVLEACSDDVIDLTVSNPTRCGFDYPESDILAALLDPAALRYTPDPLGKREAREAVVRALGLSVGPEQVLLTASTSEAYALLFKLLCDPGDAVAVCAPSYPLVEHLAELECVGVRPYRLVYEGRWRLDLDSLGDALEQGVRAVVLISPNNPTGSGVGPDEAEALRQRCAEAGVPLIVDEVFAPYVDSEADVATFARGESSAGSGTGEPLTFVLDGLSKRAGLPQLKLGWVVVCGPQGLVQDATRRLEWIADAYLSVATPVQLALPRLFTLAPGIQEQIRRRVSENRVRLSETIARLAASDLLAADGGWYGVLRVPRTRSEEEIVSALATRFKVVVHPGFFYDFQHEGYLVVSLLQEPRTFARGADRLADGLMALSHELQIL